MAFWTVSWNAGMTAAVVLLIVGGGVVIVSSGPGDPLYLLGVGILALSAAVYLGARIWMITRKRDR